MDLEVLLVLALLLLAVATYALVKRRAVLAALMLPLALLAGGAWIGETVGLVNL